MSLDSDSELSGCEEPDDSDLDFGLQDILGSNTDVDEIDRPTLDESPLFSGSTFVVHMLILQFILRCVIPTMFINK